MFELPVETLAWLTPRIPPALVSSEALARIRAVAAVLPAVRGLSFECRLGASSNRVDFIAGVSSGWGRDELIADPSGRRSGPGWEALSALCSAWARPSELLHEQIPCIWVEFDLHDGAAAVPEPFVSCCVQPRFFQGRLFGKPGAGGERVQKIMERVAHLLGRGAVAPAALRAATACFHALPEQAAVMHVAGSQVRGVNGLRIVVIIDKREIPAYLERIGWPGDPSALPSLLCVAGFGNDAELYLDVGEGVLPSLGCSSPLFQSAEDPRTRILLDRIVELGLCTPEKRDAALGWLGCEEAMLPGMKWSSRILRYQSLKLVHRPGQPIEAKAYLELFSELKLVH